ncbi:MAG TPA: FAD-dependent oxidoreductase [Gemmatimonadaceae bacterium]|nr:FAD-dependent oxidoreductase [Gemmatimonadaceae bacterium]
MDLISPRPFWLLRNGLGDVAAPLAGDVSCDVVVIGGGITGALCADALSGGGRSVLVVDKRQPGLGSTSASTALLQYDLDEPLTKLTEKIGAERAKDAYHAALDGVKSIGRICRSLPTDVGFRERPTVYFASSAKDAKAFAKEYEARRATGLPCELLSKTDLKSVVDFSAPAALRNSAGAEVDPWRLSRALFERAQERGTVVCGRTSVKRITARSDHVKVVTDRGDISAQRVVVASGYEGEQLLPKKVAKLHSTYAIATEPVSSFDGWPDRSLIWESSRPYLYLRTTEDNRIVVGGLDDPFRDPSARDRRVTAKARGLLKKAQRLFPRIEMEVAFAWAGTFGETEDSLPFIGTHPQLDDRIFFALAYGANGMPFAAIAAELVGAHSSGRRHRFEHTFIFNR